MCGKCFPHGSTTLAWFLWLWKEFYILKNNECMAFIFRSRHFLLTGSNESERQMVYIAIVLLPGLKFFSSNKWPPALTKYFLLSTLCAICHRTDRKSCGYVWCYACFNTLGIRAGDMKLRLESHSAKDKNGLWVWTLKLLLLIIHIYPMWSYKLIFKNLQILVHFIF